MNLFNSKKIAKVLAERGLTDVPDEVAYQAEAILSELDQRDLLRDNNKRLNLDDRASEATVAYLRALVEQNWIMIQQNNQILKALQPQNRPTDSKDTPADDAAATDQPKTQ